MRRYLAVAALAALTMAASPSFADESFIGSGEFYRQGSTGYFDIYNRSTGEAHYFIGTTRTCNGGGNRYDYMAGFINGKRSVNFTLINCKRNLVNLCVKIDNAGGYQCTAVEPY